jgi:NADH-quinone oxidoreductase subunit G
MKIKLDNEIKLEVNGVQVTAERGQMLIEVTDRLEAYVPRFCYHRKLSVAANCRMCLVEVEKAPKPLPACATPVVDGMKVFTRSERAISAQKATMEFLLINHPLDCPICDQGGECELQDLAMGFGRGVSRYSEGKRVVKDKNLGPLVSTDMTRCIHCTRCVRFGQEIAGVQELGAVGRSEDMEIGTYIEKSVDHELSGNIIDLCPVGALNNKPYRFSARAWEMVEKPLISPHDCAGSNLRAHVLRGKLRRIVPGENEAINETWISDRDRFSCYGIYSEERLERPMLKRDQEWVPVSWQEALEFATDSVSAAVKDEGDVLGVLANPSSTVEELHLLKRIANHFGSRNLDHRLRRADFRDQALDPVWPWLGLDVADIEQCDGILVVGSNLRMEVPIIAHRLRKAAQAGAKIGFINPIEYRYEFGVAAFAESPIGEMAAALAGVLVAAADEMGQSLPQSLKSELDRFEPTAAQAAAAGVLLHKSEGWLVLGQIALRHPRFSEIRRLAAELAKMTGAKLGYLSEGANSAGASLVGFLPHREAGGAELEAKGYDTQAMLESPRRAYMLLNVEPDQDLTASAVAYAALNSADVVVALTPYTSETLLECADVLLPIGSFAETAGTYINGEGRWQSFEAAADCVGDARPAWRVLRVMGNMIDLPDCHYESAEDVRLEVEQLLGEPGRDNSYSGDVDLELDPVDVSIEQLDVPIYSVDSVVRHSEPLQATAIAGPRQPQKQQLRA